MCNRLSRHLAGVGALGLSLVVGASVVSARQASTPTWITTKGKTVSLTLIAAYNRRAPKSRGLGGVLFR